MRKGFPLIFLFSAFYFFTFPVGYGAFEEGGTGARPMAMGGAFTAVANDVNAIYCNPAGLELVKRVEVMGMTTQLFGEEDLTLYLFGGVVPIRKLGVLGLSFSQFGFSEYRETQTILSLGQRLGTGICLGLNVKIMNLKIEGASANSDYGKASALGLDMGVLGDFGSKFRLGAMAMNLNSPRLGNCPENLAQTIRLGVSFQPFPGYTGSLDFHLPMSSVIIEPEIRVGFEATFTKNLTLRAGVENNPARLSGGFGFRWDIFRFDYAFLSHPFLNGQHLFSFSLQLDSKN